MMAAPSSANSLTTSPFFYPKVLKFSQLEWHKPTSLNFEQKLAEGFEPPTGGLQNRCSTPELCQRSD